MKAPAHKALLIYVRFHDGRYHGLPEWPPSPARLFQALVAGAAKGSVIFNEHRDSLAWLEKLDAPTIAAPPVRKGQTFSHFMPNNDLDTVGGDLARIAKIRTATKRFRPQIFDRETSFQYIWLFEQSVEHAERMCDIAEGLYQLGRGVDMAWAWGEIIDEIDLETRLARHGRAIYRPTRGNEGNMLDCPEPGSLASLENRFAANRKRFTRKVEIKKKGKKEVEKISVTFSKPPKPHFRSVAYNSPSNMRLFELRSTTPEAPFAPWPKETASTLVVQIRDAAVKRLEDALPDQKSLIERVLIGRNASEADKAARVRIVPLPSIGHIHADRAIRRVLVEVAADCPIRTDDITWAFSGLVVATNVDTSTGEALEETRMIRAPDLGMLRHYGVESSEKFRHWRTVTPAALPERAKRHRIGPRNKTKNASKRIAKEARASTAVLQALRHTGIQAKVEALRVQREPFSAKGARAEAFAPETRFPKERLWHVEINFSEPLEGPLVVGDGRYMGLGLMEPVRRTEGVFAFSITAGLSTSADPIALSRTLRRATMARVQALLGSRTQLPAFFTGHHATGEVLRDGNHKHLAFAADLGHSRLVVLAPHLLEGRSPTNEERRYLEKLDYAFEGLTDLRAGTAGYLKLIPCSIDGESDPLFSRAKMWESLTDYRPTRHAKCGNVAEILVRDTLVEIRRRGLPRPAVEVTEVREGPRGGLAGRLRLRFHVAQAGPILIGRTRHYGGGMFQGIQGENRPTIPPSIPIK